MAQVAVTVNVTVNFSSRLPAHIRVDLMYGGAKIAEKIILITQAGVAVQALFTLPEGSSTVAANYSALTFYQDGNQWSNTTQYRNRAALPSNLIGGLAFLGEKLGVV